MPLLGPKHHLDTHASFFEKRWSHFFGRFCYIIILPIGKKGKEQLGHICVAPKVVPPPTADLVLGKVKLGRKQFPRLGSKVSLQIC